MLRNLLLSFAALAASAAVPASANLIITATFDPTITADTNAASIIATINSVIGVYQNSLLDPINVAIKFSEMSGGLGQSATAFDTLRYVTYRNALVADATSGTDAIALARLLVDGAGANNPANGSVDINVKTANLRAVGLSGSPGAGNPDGTVSINTHLTDIGSPGTTGQYSLVAVLEHEINEVLGLNSGLDFTFGPFPEDLFRFKGSGTRSYSTSDSNVYLSYDGVTQIVGLNQSGSGDYGDWASSSTVRVQDAFATPGTHPVLGFAELSALDAIGYNTVPEPATWALLLISLVSIAGYRRLQTVRVKS